MIRLTLPYPPSANRYWRVRAMGGKRPVAIVYKSAEAKKYKEVVAKLAAHLTPVTSVVKVVLRVFRPKKIGDLDNVNKVLLDALSGYAYVDDKQIIELHSFRNDDKADPRVEVEIEEVL